VGCAKMAKPIKMPIDPDAVWVMDSGGPKEACTRGGPDPHAKGQFLGERTCLGMPDNTLP